MHFIGIARGIKHQMDLWESIMQSQWFQWKRKNLKTGKDEMCMVQGAYRPIQLFEYIVPREVMPEVLGNMGCTNEDGGVSMYLPGHQKKMWLLQKAMGLDKVEIPKNFVRNRVMQIPGVSVHPIGIKPDKVKAWDERGYEQEML